MYGVAIDRPIFVVIAILLILGHHQIRAGIKIPTCDNVALKELSQASELSQIGVSELSQIVEERADLHRTLFPGGVIATASCVCLARQQNVPLLTSPDDIVLVDRPNDEKSHQTLSFTSITNADDGQAWGVYCNYYGLADRDLLLSHLAISVRKAHELPTRSKICLTLTVPDEFQQLYSLMDLASMFKDWFGAAKSDIYVEPYVVAEYLRPIQDLADRGSRNQVVNMLN